MLFLSKSQSATCEKSLLELKKNIVKIAYKGVFFIFCHLKFVFLFIFSI